MIHVEPDHIRDIDEQYALDEALESGGDAVAFLRDEEGTWYAKVQVNLASGWGHSWHRLVAGADALDAIHAEQAKKWDER